MGPRDESELSPSDADLAMAEAETRRLLAAYGEPTTIEPPAGMVARVLAALPAPPGRAGRRPPRTLWRPRLAWAAATLLLALGTFAVLAALPGLAVVDPHPDSTLARLGRALAETPVGDLLVGTGGAAALAVLAIGAGAWLWWRLARRRRDE